MCWHVFNTKNVCQCWFQIELYKEDFSIERRDRERAQCEKDSLQQKLKDAQEVISTLTQEVLEQLLKLVFQNFILSNRKSVPATVLLGMNFLPKFEVATWLHCLN